MSLYMPDGSVHVPGHKGEAKVCCISMSAGNIFWRTAESIVYSVVTQAIHTTMFLCYGPYLDDGRNRCVRTFLDPSIEKEGLTHLLLVDSDIEFLPSDVMKLVQADKDIITGVYHSEYPNMDPIVRPIIYKWGTNEAGDKRLVPIEKWDDGWPLGGVSEHEDIDPIIPVVSGGAGFLLIQKHVLEKMALKHEEPCPWFHEPVSHGSHLGEDHGFFLRAAEDGYQLYAHRGVQLAHHKTTRIGGFPREF